MLNIVIFIYQYNSVSDQVSWDLFIFTWLEIIDNLKSH